MFALNEMPIEYILSIHFNNLTAYCKTARRGDLLYWIDNYKNGKVVPEFIQRSFDNLKGTYGDDFNSFVSKNYLLMKAS